MCPSVGPSVRNLFFRRAETKTANDLFRVYELVFCSLLPHVSLGWAYPQPTAIGAPTVAPKQPMIHRDIAWLDHVARLQGELRDELPGPYHSLEHIFIKTLKYTVNLHSNKFQGTIPTSALKPL